MTEVIITPQCWRGILHVLGDYDDGQETGSALLVSRHENVIVCQESGWPYPGDFRSESQLEVKDGMGHRLEEARRSLGVEHFYAGHWHLHPSALKPTPSPADEMAWGLRERAEIGNVFVGLILTPEDNTFANAATTLPPTSRNG